MPVLTILKTYANGNVLTEADLDNIKNSIETFLNVTKIDDSNIQADGISIDKLTPTARASLFQSGMMMFYAGPTAPSGTLLCYGQEVAIASFTSLNTAIGTTHNTGGEAPGNFRLPDARGRALFGRDDMGGVAANRITNAISGIVGTTLGAFGGHQSVGSHVHPLTAAITSGASQNHTHSVSGTTSSDGDHDHFPEVTGGATISDPTGDPAGAARMRGSDQTDPIVATSTVHLPTVNHTHTYSTTSGGQSQDHTHTLSGSSDANTSAGTGANIPPALILNVIIKT